MCRRAPARRRQRSVEDLAEELAWLNRERGVEAFSFHDDNFLPPDQRDSLRRIAALADELGRRNVGPFVTVVKARPNDVTLDVFEQMRDRLGLIRAFLGIESDAPAGLRTLRRGVSQAQNHRALRILQRLGIYACFNLLVFDPDTTLEGLEVNLAFMEAFAEVPSNFGRVELYAGTLLLARMQAEGRCSGDYLGWDYSLADPQIQRVFELALACFRERNFAAGALANRLLGTRFEVEVCRRFHPDVFRDEWLLEAKALSRALAEDSVAALRRISAHVRAAAGKSGLVVRLRSEIFLARDDDALAFAADPTLTGAILLRVTRQAHILEIDFVPLAGASTVDAVLPLGCNASASCHHVRLGVGQPERAAHR